MTTGINADPATLLRISVGVFTPDGVVDPKSLASASAMVKTGLMYADRVQLISHDGSVSLAIALADPQGPLSVTEGFEDQVAEMLRAHTDNDVYRVVQRQLIDWSDGFSRQDAAKFFIDSVVAAVKEPGRYPLLDYRTLSNLNSYRPEEKSPQLTSALERGKHAFLARALMERLPKFDDVPLDELLDIRHALEKYLIRFRAGLMKLSAGVESNPWSAEFARDVEDWVLREIEPSILEIEEAVRANRVGGKVTRAVVDRPVSWAYTGGMSILLAQSHVVPQLLAAAVGLGTGVSLTAVDVIRAWQHQTREIESGALFLYYRLRQRVG